jgi:hypothetical protein
MSPRLTELLKQRAQLQEHLAWLDREIANEQSAAPSPPPLPSAAPVAANSQFQTSNSSHSSTLPYPRPPLSSPDGSLRAQNPADQILGQYKQDPGLLQQDTRKGCLIAAAIVGTLLLLAAFTIYAVYAHRLGRWW